MQIVNGYVCQTCTDVENAKKYIDPAHPQQGPAGKEDAKPKAHLTAAAVTFGGTLSDPPPTRRDGDPAEHARRPGARIDISS